MATETITGKLNGVTVSTQVDVVDGVRISDIGEDTEWELTTIDDSPTTYVTPHVGGRPDDRK